MSVEQNPNIIDTEIVGSNTDDALLALQQREKNVLTEAQEFGIGEIQCTEFTHRNEYDVCSFINDAFPDLANLVLPEKK